MLHFLASCSPDLMGIRFNTKHKRVVNMEHKIWRLDRKKDLNQQANLQIKCEPNSIRTLIRAGPNEGKVKRQKGQNRNQQVNHWISKHNNHNFSFVLIYNRCSFTICVCEWCVYFTVFCSVCALVRSAESRLPAQQNLGSHYIPAALAFYCRLPNSWRLQTKQTSKMSVCVLVT